jgi:hypothetical protein
MARTIERDDTASIRFAHAAFDGYTGALTFAAIVKKASDDLVMSIHNIQNATPTARMGLRFSAGNLLEIFTSSGSGASTTTVAVADGWCLLVGTRAAGTTTPRLHIYKFGTGVWTHEDGASGFADGLSAAAASHVIGTSTAVGNALDAHTELHATWKRALADAEIENLAISLQDWYAAAPEWMVKLDQSLITQTVANLVGVGGHQSGITATTVSTVAVPLFNYGVGVGQAVDITGPLGSAGGGGGGRRGRRRLGLLL